MIKNYTCAAPRCKRGAVAVIKRILSRDEALKSNWGTICILVEMEAADGRKRKVQAADTKGLLRIIQSIPSPKAEPFIDSFSCTKLSYN